MMGLGPHLIGGADQGPVAGLTFDALRTGEPCGHCVHLVGMEGPILELASSSCEVDMDTARPRAIGPAQRTIAAGLSTPGMVREQAFAGDDRWVGVVRTGPASRSGWHHHGDTDTYFYVLSGAMELEFGPGGRERLLVGAGDYAHVPRGVIHREGTTPDQPAEVALVRIGPGVPVVNVESPEPE
jgi:uncharacterized RmlC-like cupin family protein